MNEPKKGPTATYKSSLSYHSSAVNVVRFSPSGGKIRFTHCMNFSFFLLIFFLENSSL